MAYNETSNMVNRTDEETKHGAQNTSTADDHNFFAASASDMTGLARTIAHNEYEAESYEELYPYLPPLPPNSVITTPDTPIAEGIHAEYRTQVTRQHPKKDKH